MWKHFSKVLVRTPVLSIDNTETGYAVMNADLPELFIEGIYLSSESFWNQYLNLSEISTEDRNKVERTLFKYLIRSSTRCTPYGTFAGTALCHVNGEETNITLTGSHIRHVRIDMEYLTSITNAINHIPHVFSQIRFYTNNSLYKLPDSYRYAEYELINGARFYNLTFAERTDYLDRVIERASNGATARELESILVASENVSVEDAQQYIKSLFESQLLTSELEPCITGQDPLSVLIDKLSKLKYTEILTEQLKKIKSLINCPTGGVNYYDNIKNIIKNIGIDNLSINNVFQTDMYLGTSSNTVNDELLSSIIEQVTDLTVLSYPKHIPSIDNFKKRYYQKYEESEMPLNLVLDPDYGIGYGEYHDESVGGSVFIDDIPIGSVATENKPDHNFIQRFCISKYHNYLKDQKSVIELTEQELNQLSKRINRKLLPNNMYILGQLLKTKEKLSSQDYCFDLLSFGGPSGANLLGRFTQGNRDIHDFVDDILKQESANVDDVIFAEIVHLPQARVGNILLRPTLREYEIIYVGKSGTPLEKQIKLDDLMVSIINGNIILRSKKLNKRVVPRLTSAHFFGGVNLPVYKFLCDLQSHSYVLPNLWDWGEIVAADYLPRVVYKNVIIRKARWRLRKKNIPEILTVKEERMIFFRKYCDNNKLPRKVLYIEGDNELMIDFEEQKSVDILLHYLKRHENIVVEEFLFSEENCFVKDTEGRSYTNELLIPIYNTNVHYQYLIQPRSAIQQNTKRCFFPGEEWSYYKLYCGPKNAEKILSRVVLPFIDSCHEKEMFSRFFYIRFKDDFFHIRLRFYNENADAQHQLHRAFLKTISPYVESGLVDRIVVDTYHRELERYSADLIDECEMLFSNDSIAVLRFINILDGIEAEHYRFIFAMKGIDYLLNDFCFSTKMKHDLLKSVQNSYYMEFGGRPSLLKLLNKKYKKYQRMLFSHMDVSQDELNEIDHGSAVFEERSKQNRQVVQKIREKFSSEDYKQKMLDLLPSLMHMFTNRLFVGQPRKHELVVYHFLERYYSSQCAIEKNVSKVTTVK